MHTAAGNLKSFHCCNVKPGSMVKLAYGVQGLQFCISQDCRRENNSRVGYEHQSGHQSLGKSIREFSPQIYS